MSIVLCAGSSCTHTRDERAHQRSTRSETAIQQVLTVAQEAAGLVPSPYTPAVQAGLAGTSLLLALYARARHAAAQRNAEQLHALIDGVERLPGEEAKQAKRSIREAASIAGVQPDLHRTVEAVTAKPTALQATQTQRNIFG